MKRTILVLSVLIFSSTWCIGQPSEEAYYVARSVTKLRNSGEIEKAVDSTLKLYSLSKSEFNYQFNTFFPFEFKGDKKDNAKKFIDALYNRNEEEINTQLAPLYLWSKTKTNEDLSGISDELLELLGDSSNYENKTERYSLIILKELEEKKAIDANTIEKILLKNISNLEKYPYLEEVTSGAKEGQKRAWHRYLLAYSYNYLASLNKKNEEYLKKASYFSPNKQDLPYDYIYVVDAYFLKENPKELSFQSNYYKFLDKNKPGSEALELLTEITFEDPSNRNMKKLKQYFDKSNSNESFAEYWSNYINSKGKPAPNIKIQFDNEELDFGNKINGWTYLDFWGTWCKPCIEELPKLQSYYAENNSPNLKIMTLAYNSKNLKEFMAKNNYTFPVSEIGKETSELFEVYSFPTKILISPQGVMIRIPFGRDWEEYIRNYMMI